MLIVTRQALFSQVLVHMITYCHRLASLKSRPSSSRFIEERAWILRLNFAPFKPSQPIPTSNHSESPARLISVF
ncbi:hypothetical protein NXS19_001013 [Fusarium pseudograminearum]|nr:hypothetical protein NXS19_001013 [Fusarium pseudograminearum]